MIRCHLTGLMGEQKMRLGEVIRETGLRCNTLTLTHKEIAQKVKTEALEKLSDLSDCEVNEILKHVLKAGFLNGKAAEHLTAMELSL